MNILNLSFNQPVTHLSSCTENGYAIYSLAPQIEKKIHNDKFGGVGFMKILHRTNIYGLVGGGTDPFRSRDIMVLWDDNKSVSVIEIDMKEQIKNIIINNDRIIIILERKICTFNFEGNLMEDIKSTYFNKEGICVVSADEVKPTYATLGIKKGEVSIWKKTSNVYKGIQAHNSNISTIALNKEGTLVATGSETGTLIKVFNTETGNQLYEFRRGSTSIAIYDLAFSRDSRLLACCSGNGTVHLFELYNSESDTKNMQSMLSGLSGYLPAYFSSKWSFKQIYIETKSKMICSFDDENVLHVATFEGKYYKIHGNDYEIVKTNNLYSSDK